MARNTSMPPARNNSSMLSSEDESEPSWLTSGRIFCRSGNKGVWNLGVLASDQLRLPSMVLISPLCARKRKGWAYLQFGRVLVEKR